MQAATPSVTVNPWTAELRPAHWRAYYRMLIGGVLRTLIFTGVASWLVGLWGVGLLAALPFVAFVDWLAWKRERWLVTPRSVVVRRGLLRQSTWVLDRAKIQSVDVVQTPLMRIHGLGRVIVQVAGNAVVLPDVALDVALHVFQDLTRVPPASPQHSEAA